jgi:hypothetical protein
VLVSCSESSKNNSPNRDILDLKKADPKSTVIEIGAKDQDFLNLDESKDSYDKAKEELDRQYDDFGLEPGKTLDNYDDILVLEDKVKKAQEALNLLSKRADDINQKYIATNTPPQDEDGNVIELNIVERNKISRLRNFVKDHQSLIQNKMDAIPSYITEEKFTQNLEIIDRINKEVKREQAKVQEKMPEIGAKIDDGTLTKKEVRDFMALADRVEKMVTEALFLSEAMLNITKGYQYAVTDSGELVSPETLIANEELKDFLNVSLAEQKENQESLAAIQKELPALLAAAL